MGLDQGNAQFGVFSGKRVLITGHTGFKGAWLTAWLQHLGAEVTGVGLDPVTEPSLHTVMALGSSIRDIRQDIRDFDALMKIVHETRPDFVFHLAAQAIVSRSFTDPLYTFETNVVGSINLLESIRQAGKPTQVVMVTSDKAYSNQEWVWGYRESDRLGGHDPYSGSKAAAEMGIASYVDSFFGSNSGIRIGIARAGNVIGGGDWSTDRIVPDAVRSWRSAKQLVVRNSRSTRPWQHVLEPLSGYLTLASRLASDPAIGGEAFNFGPEIPEGRSVADLVMRLERGLPGLTWTDRTEPHDLKEAGLLQLNCEKARSLLGWRSVLSFDDTVDITCDWYSRFFADEASALRITRDQIERYTDLRSQAG